MDMSNQTAFIDRIRSALGQSPERRRSADGIFTGESTAETGKIIDRIKNRTAVERRQLLDRLIEMAEPINLKVFVLKDPPSVATAIAGLVRNKDPEWGDQKSIVTWKHPLIESLNIADVLADQNVPVYVTAFEDNEAEGSAAEKERTRLRKCVIDSYIGVTSADYCMAETASLVMRAHPGQARSVSLVPSIHVAVIYLNQIIADLKELYALIKNDAELPGSGLTNCMTFISGPSKTADVEATMVHGAHGPREVYVYVITDG